VPGILHPREAERAFRFRDVPAAPGLAPFVAHHWIVAWDLRGREPHDQQVLPYPSVNVTFTAGRCRVAGVPKGRFTERIAGTGRVVGVRFRPGGFRPLIDSPVAAITDRFLPVDAVFGPAGRRLADAVVAAGDNEAVALVEEFLAARLPARPDADADLVAAIVDRIVTDPAVTRVDRLVADVGLGIRRAQRLFNEYVGVGPKWVIRRYRLHDAAARATGGDDLDLVRLAADLGYSDQAHLTRDFTAMVGVPPARYARAQR